jgi:hypothetical protein
MKLVLSRTVVRQIFRALKVTRKKFAEPVLLIGRREGDRLVIENACRKETQSGASTRSLIGNMFFRPEKRVFADLDDRWRLSASERRHIANMLLEKNELAAVVTIVERHGDLAFYPAYFSRENPRGVDMALQYEGSTLCQQHSALGGTCRAPHQETIKPRYCHRQVPVKVQGRWITVDQEIARLVSVVNQIPGIASTMSCQGGRPTTGERGRPSAGQAWLRLVPVQYASTDFFVRMHLIAVARTRDPRLSDITQRLRLKFEQHLGKSLAVTRARHPYKGWACRGIPKMYPKLRLGNVFSSFYWNPKDTPKMLASAEELLQQEIAMVRTGECFG